MTVPTTAGAAAEAAGSGDGDGVVRILVLGDSVTQGSAGDWTWRYRLARHLEQTGVAFDLVGPRDDLWDNVAQQHGSHAYADPAFDRDHAGRWGMWAAFPDVPVASLVATYEPDVVVEMLGVNDLLWSSDPPEVAAASVRSTVLAARSADPGVHVVLAEATQHWFSGVPAFNAALGGVASELSTVDAPVVVARTADGYDAERDTWDNSHPNARGEVRIAAAVADALADLDVGGPAARPLDLPPVGSRQAPTAAVTAADEAVRLTWTGPPGATRHLLWSRDVTTDGAWSLRRSDLAASGATTVGGLRNGHTYAFRIQPAKGDDTPEGAVFATVTATPRAPRTVLEAPRRLRAVDRGRRCVRLRWAAVEGATGYVVQRRTASGWTRPVRTRRAAVTLRRLPARAAWRLRVRAVAEGVTGPGDVVRVRRGRGGC